MDDINRGFRNVASALSQQPIGRSVGEHAPWVETASESHVGEPSTNGQLQKGVSALIQAMRSALEGDAERARYYIGDAAASLYDGRDKLPDATKGGVSPCTGGLAPWQMRRLKLHIDENLEATIHCDDLAQLVRLSLSHFMRAFKQSFGSAPHAFLISRRIERAQRLMLTTGDALGQIALACGLADQAHLTRLFQRWVGESPAAWRRARRHAPMA